MKTPILRDKWKLASPESGSLFYQNRLVFYLFGILKSAKGEIFFAAIII